MNRKFIIFLLVSIFTIQNFSGVSLAASNSSKVKVTIELTSIDCIENNHVGNEWGFACSVNKKELQEGDSLDIETSSTGKITIVCQAVEYDKYPDAGTKTLSISVGNLKSNKTNTYTAKTTVVENRGRYSGNSAVWEFTFSITKK